MRQHKGRQLPRLHPPPSSCSTATAREEASTNLHFGVVWGHPKTDEPEGNKQLLIDVHSGPAVVLQEKEVAVKG